MIDNRISLDGLKPSQRLDALLEVMAKVHDEHFDWGTWANRVPKSLNELTMASVDPSCGTRACVAGTAAVAFQGWSWDGLFPIFQGNGQSSFHSFAECFGITEFEAEDICLPGGRSGLYRNDKAGAVQAITDVRNKYAARGE